MMSDLISNFPEDYQPSDSQTLLLRKIEEGFSRKKFVICCAPTGSGKSFISKTIGNSSSDITPEFEQLIKSYDAFRQDYEGNYTYEPDCMEEDPFGSFVLTITKSLQDQYTGLFPDSGILKGKNNYTCAVDNSFDCDTAPCLLTPKLKNECWDTNKCPYYVGRNEALTSKFTTLNYKMFMSLPGHVKRKEYIICDESSELEEALINHFSLVIDPEKLKIVGVKTLPVDTQKYDSVLRWLNALCIQVAEEESRTLQILQSRKNSEKSNNDKIKYNYLKSIHRSINLVVDNWYECEFVIQREDSKIKFTPLRIDNLTKHVFDYADKVLLMSATIIDHKTYARTLGITDYEYVEVDSQFDPSKAPIYINPDLKLNFANMDKNLPAVVKHIKAILSQHKNEKGIIHTHSMKITEYLKDNIDNDRLLFRTNMSNEDLLREHTTSDKPTVLVTPSMVFGVDLKDDLARFQIIVKAAYPPLGDLRIKKMFELDKQWYTDKMLIAIIQACGRGVRTKDDHCVTYILDGCVYDAIKSNKNNIPRYFLNRFV